MSNNELDNSVLFNALDNGDMFEVHKELVRNPDAVKERDSENRVPLHYAADCANLETFRQIFEIDPTLIDAQDSVGFTPLLIAVMAGNIDVAEFLLQRGAQLSHMDKDKHTAVHWAVVCAQIETLICLIKYGAACNIEDKYGAYPLHYATIIEDVSTEISENILHLLLKENLNVDCIDTDGRTPLIWSASNGNENALKSLVQAGADINAVDRDRLNALHCASSHGHLEILKILLDWNQRNAINVKDCNGDTPLFYASTFGHYECAKILVENGANVNHLDKRLRSAAHCAAAKGQLRILRLLKQYGASFALQNHRGDLPLHEAVQTGSKELVEWFLTLTPKSASTPNFYGRTPLHLASANGSVELVILLCQRNVPINPLMMYKNELFTPLDVAERRNYDLIVEYLRGRHNAKKAAELSQNEKRKSWTDIEENLKTGKLRKYRARISSPDESDEEKTQKNRRKVGKNSLKNQNRHKKSIQSDLESSRINHNFINDSSSIKASHRSSSATGSFFGEYVPKATSTTDLHTLNNNNSSGLLKNTNNKRLEEDRFVVELERKLVESTIQKIVQKELQKQADEDKKREGSFDKDENFKEKISQAENMKNLYETNKNKQLNENDKKEETTNSEKVLVDSDDGTFLTNQSLIEEETQSSPINGSSISKKLISSKKSAGSPKKVKLISNDPIENAADTHTEAKKKPKMNQTSPLELHIIEDNWQSFYHKGDSSIERRFVHEKAIFEELTHLKRMQIQYGKVQERTLVRSLIRNFCKMHAINSAHFRDYQTFFDWEKFLYGLLSDQLKLIYMEERDHIQSAAHTATNAVAMAVSNPHLSHRYRSSARLLSSTPLLPFKFENRLHKTVPLDERLRELTRIYSSSPKRRKTRISNDNGISGCNTVSTTPNLTTNSKKIKSAKLLNSRNGRNVEANEVAVGKRCECLGKHLLIT